MFKPIDRAVWKREDYFNHYFHEVPCSYSMTVNLDVTQLKWTLKAEGLSFAAAMIYLLTRQVNRHEEFRTAVDAEGQLGVFDAMHPSYAVFHEETETFSTLWTTYHADFRVFHENYHSDMLRYGEREGLVPQPDMPDNVFNISNIPWTSFTGFNLNLPKGATYLLPIFTLGRYFCQGEQTLLPLAVQVHHAVCDGFHVCRFINELQETADRFERLL